MVALVQRVSKLEKKVADRPQTGNSESRSVYQPNAEELAEAVAILVGCGAVRVVDAIVDKDRKDSADGIAI